MSENCMKYKCEIMRQLILLISQKIIKMIANKLFLMFITQNTLKHNEINATKPNY